MEIATCQHLLEDHDGRRAKRDGVRGLREDPDGEVVEKSRHFRRKKERISNQT